MTLFEPGNQSLIQLPPVVDHQEISAETRAVVMDGETMIGSGQYHDQNAYHRLLFLSKPGQPPSRLMRTPDGEPFSGTLHLYPSPAGIVAVAEDGQGFLLRRKGNDEEYRLAELRAASGDARETALLAAADTGQLDKINSLLTAGVNINAVDRRGWTPLDYALHRQHPEATLHLIRKGADIHHKTEQGSTPLTFAAQANQVTVVQELLTRRVTVDEANILGGTPLWYAAIVGATDAGKLLIAAGADVNHRGTTGLHNPILLEAAWRGQLESVKLLLQHGARLDDPDLNQNTALMCAANAGQTNVVKYLIEQGANVNAANRDRWTVLMQAVGAKQLESVRMLAEAGADVNAERGYGHTVLMDAADKSTIEIVQCLIDHGANVSAEGDLQWTALRYAEIRKRNDVVLLLRRALEAEKQKGKP